MHWSQDSDSVSFLLFRTNCDQFNFERKSLLLPVVLTVNQVAYPSLSDVIMFIHIWKKKTNSTAFHPPSFIWSKSKPLSFKNQCSTLGNDDFYLSDIAYILTHCLLHSKVTCCDNSTCANWPRKKGIEKLAQGFLSHPLWNRSDCCHH